MSLFLVLNTALVLAATPEANSLAASGDASTLVEPDQFEQFEALTGDGWSLTRCAIEGDYEWGAEFRAGEKILYKFGQGASKEDVRVHAWPSLEDARLLCVYRRGGGQHGPYALDVVDLKGGFKRVLTSERGAFQFRFGMQDLDGDGWPEFVGRSDAFESAPELPWDIPGFAEPFPSVIMTYDPSRHRYRSGAFLFPKFMAPSCDKWESEFTQRLQANNLQGPLPATLLQDRDTPDGPQFELLWWVLELVYSGREKDAWAALDKHCEPALAEAMRASIKQVLERDTTYTDMIHFRKEKGKP